MPAMILESPVSKDKDELRASKQDDSSSFILMTVMGSFKHKKALKEFSSTIIFLVACYLGELNIVLILNVLILNSVDSVDFVE